MKQSRKLKRVSWAPGSNLCQVIFFLSEECPSEVGKKTNEFDDPPPGFEGVFLNQKRLELFNIPHVRWKCPTLFALRDDWSVAVGEESKEKHVQELREAKVSKVNCPLISAISSRSSSSFDVEECYDDNLTPLIPIEEREESRKDVNPNVAIARLVKSGADLSVALTVAAAIIKANKEGNLINLNLLPKIVSDPRLILKIIDAYRIDATTTRSPEVVASKITPTSTLGLLHTSWPRRVTSTATSFVPLSRPLASISSTMTVSSTSINMHGEVGYTTPRFLKNPDYYKKLIREYGIDKRDSQIYQKNFQDLKRPRDNNIEPGESKFKFQKPCKFFRRSRGCLNGSDCLYHHDMLDQSKGSCATKPAKILRL